MKVDMEGVMLQTQRHKAAKLSLQYMQESHFGHRKKSSQMCSFPLDTACSMAPSRFTLILELPA